MSVDVFNIVDINLLSEAVLILMVFPGRGS